MTDFLPSPASANTVITASYLRLYSGSLHNKQNLFNVGGFLKLILRLTQQCAVHGFLLSQEFDPVHSSLHTGSNSGATVPPAAAAPDCTSTRLPLAPVDLSSRHPGEVIILSSDECYQ